MICIKFEETQYNAVRNIMEKSDQTTWCMYTVKVSENRSIGELQTAETVPRELGGMQSISSTDRRMIIPENARNVTRGDRYRYTEALIPRPWQTEAINALNIQDDRKITVVCDKRGGAGKTYLTKWLEANGAVSIPISPDGVQMIRHAYHNPAKVYIFDIPRGYMRDGIGIWEAIESVKDGLMADGDSDTPFAYRRIAPKVIVMTNMSAREINLSEDRQQVIDPQERLNETDESAQ